jgi:hypothetical protein
MKAFVKTNNGTFPNLNFYMAWEGFNAMGYNVTLFEEDDYDFTGGVTYDTLSDGTQYPCINSKKDLASSYKPNRCHQITVDTPVFAGVTVFRKVIDKLGIDYPPFDCYPTVLNHYYGRNLRKSTLGEEKAKFAKDNIPVFIKPVLPKQFIGAVWKSFINLIPLAKVPDDAEVWVCEPIDILSEFRVYVQDGEILGVKHYYGDWSVVPTKSKIEKIIKAYKPCPVAYGIDFATIKKRGELKVEENYYGYTDIKDTIVLEVNDGCNLGNYGIDSIHYGEMIVSRWFEIMADHKISKKIQDRIEWDKDYTTRDGVKYSDRTKDLYYSTSSCDGKSMKDRLVAIEQTEIRAKSMKSFAEEVRKSISETDNL